MSKLFFAIKRRDYPALGASPDRYEVHPPVYPSCFFLDTPPEATVSVNPTYRDVPFFQEKLRTLKHLIKSYRATITTWKLTEPNYPLLAKVEEQLKRGLKMWAEMTGDLPCL